MGNTLMRSFLQCFFAAWTMLASAAAADWLITADGRAIETRGPWKVEGRVVVFTDTTGALSSVRLDDVDLEASETATADGGPRRTDPAPAAEPENSEREPVLVLTNADVPRGTEDRPAGWVTLTMYGTQSCGYCRKTRQLLNEMGVRFVDKDIDKDSTARREFFEKTGGRGGRLPLLDFAGVLKQGYSEQIIRAEVVRLGLVTKSE